MKAEQVKAAVKVFKVLENDDRLKILSLLRRAPMRPKAIYEAMKSKRQTNVDYHVGKLIEADLVFEGPRVKDSDPGRKILYHLNQKQYGKIIKAISILNGK